MTWYLKDSSNVWHIVKVHYFLGLGIKYLAVLKFILELQNEKKNRFIISLYDRYLSFKYAAAAAASLQSCPTLCDTIDGSP